MTDDEHVAALADAIAAVETVEADALDRPVPSCPGWTVADLITHLTSVHRWATTIIETHATERLRRDQADFPQGDELLAAFATGAARLQASLRAADLDEVLYTWTGPAPARWWLRRQVHETAVHAWDARSALGTAHPVDAPVAVDGLDELFGVFIPRFFDPAVFGGSGETMHLHATDCDGEWLLRFEPDQVVVSAEHGKGDVALRGSASDLLLVMWNRSGYDSLETFGDLGVADRFRALASF